MENKNQPAFPRDINEELDRINGNLYPPTGLTKRECFAAMAMQGMAVKIIGIEEDFNENDIAKYSVRLADALLKALETPKQ